MEMAKEKLFNKEKKISSILDEIAEVAQYMWHKGWAEKNAGNISVLLPQSISKDVLTKFNRIILQKPMPELKHKCFYITGAGKRMRDIAKSPVENGLFLQVAEKGSEVYVVKLVNENIVPTSELSTHLGVHQMIARRGTEEKVILHTHATELIALTQWEDLKSEELLNNTLWGMHPETMVVIPKGVGLVPYYLPGTDKIAQATVEKFNNYDIIVWEKHGVFAIGKNIQETFDSIDIVCKSAKIWLECRSAGFKPEGLSKEQLEEIKELINNITTRNK